MTKKQKKHQKVKKALIKFKFTWTRLLPWVVFIFAFLLYANTLNHYYAIDDNMAIFDNALVLDGFGSLPELLTKPFYYGCMGANGNNHIYRPVTLLSFAADIEFFGEKPFMFHHFMNVFLYALGVLFLFLLLKRVFREKNVLIPFIIALLYAAHPIHTEVVANIKSRDEILSLLFGLAVCLYALFKYLDTKQKKFLFLSLLSYFLGIFAKENAITFLAIIPVTVYFFSETPLKKICLLTLPYLGIVILYMMIRHLCIAEFAGGSASVTQYVPHGANLTESWIATVIFYMLKYLKLLVFPHPLVWDYSYNQIPVKHFSHPWVILSIILHLSMLVYAFLSLKKKRAHAYGILFYFITMAIYVNISLSTGATMAERYLFTPSLAFCMGLGLLLTSVFKFGPKDKAQSRLIVIVLVVLSLYTAKTLHKNKDWKDTLTVSLSAVKYHPNSLRVQSTLGAVYLKLAQYEQNPQLRKELWQKIAGICREMIRIDPRHENAWYNLGMAHFLHLGDYNQAEEAFKHNLSLEPDDVKAYNNLAGIYFIQRDFETAIHYFKRFVEHNPDDKKAVNNIGNVYLYNLKDPQKALPYFLRAIEIDSNYAEPHERAGQIYQSEGKYERAIEHFELVLNIEPSKKYLLKRIGDLYRHLGNGKKAGAYYRKYESLQKNH